MIQINGKRRGEIEVKLGTDEKEIMKEVMNLKNVSDFIANKDIKKSIYVPDKIINLVI